MAICHDLCVCVQGVMISHDNLTWTARICAELYGVNNVSVLYHVCVLYCHYCVCMSVS